LSQHRAPLIDANFENLPKCGIAAEIVEYNTAAKTIRVYGDHLAVLLTGHKVILSGSTGNDGSYTIVSAVAGSTIDDENTTVITVAETLSVNGPEAADDAELSIGQFAPAEEPAAFVTRSTLDYELDKLEPKYAYWKATASGTNVVRTLGFTYIPGKNKLWVFRNGQKLRVNMMAGGDFNETSATTITIGTVSVDDEFEIYEI
jgi:hypothetical protein